MVPEIISHPSVELVAAANVPSLLDNIRPEWQAKNLTIRVRRLLEVDPSSACQRLFNAAMHDLRDKVIIAGTDIANEAARQNRLPPVEKDEDIEEYPTAKLIDLAYRMGLLSRPDWRRIFRCYEIRRDLEHEDDEYEAGVEDCVYIFATCIEVILTKDPTHLVRVTDFKDLIEQDSSIVPEDALLEDYENAPQPRKEEILKFLVSHALDKTASDLIQQNAFCCLNYLRGRSQNQVIINLSKHLHERYGRSIDERIARVAQSFGAFAYLRQSSRADFFEMILRRMHEIGTRWTAHQHHGELLRSLIEYGGLAHCPSQQRKKILKWLILTYMGEPGGRTSYGNVRHVFYSNSAAPIIKEIIEKDIRTLKVDILNLSDDRDIKKAQYTSHISRRFEALLDIAEAI